MIASCGEEPISPTALSPEDASSSVTAATDTPFYYTQYGRVTLEAESDRFIIATATAQPEGGVEDVLASVDVEALEVSPLPRAPAHNVVRLAHDSSQDSGVLDRIRSAPGVVFAAPVYRTLETETPILLTNWVNVRFKKFVGESQIDSLADALQLAEYLLPAPDSGRVWHSFTYPADGDPLRISQELFNSPIVRVASPGMVVKPTQDYVPTDPYYSYQFNLSNPNTLYGVPVDINVESVWDYTLGENIHIVVIDDGVDLEHLDPIDGDMELPTGSALDFFGDVDPKDVPADPGSPTYPFCNDNHGTRAAGMIKAAHNNDRGVAGVAPAVEISAVRTHFWMQQCERNPAEKRFATSGEVAQGIQWAHGTANADVISVSWGYRHDFSEPLINDAIDDAINLGRYGKGTVLVFSAGNNSTGTTTPVRYPARLTSTKSLLSVSATNKTGERPAYGKQEAGRIDVVAPSGHTTNPCVGDYAPATLDRFSEFGCPADGPEGSERYTYFSGTSAAAPQVAGVAALMLSRQPELPAWKVKDRIRSSAVSWGDPSVFGEGKLDATGAVFGFSVAVEGDKQIDESKTYTWSAAIAGGGTGSYSYRWQRRVYHHTSTCIFEGPWSDVGTSSTYESSESPSGYHFQLRVEATDLVTDLTASSSYFTVKRADPMPCPY